MVSCQAGHIDSGASLRLILPESGLLLPTVKQQAGSFMGWLPTHRGVLTLRFIFGLHPSGQRANPGWPVECSALCPIVGSPTSYGPGPRTHAPTSPGSSGLVRVAPRCISKLIRPTAQTPKRKPRTRGCPCLPPCNLCFPETSRRDRRYPAGQRTPILRAIPMAHSVGWIPSPI
jgi:hypothetical protein